MLEVIDPADVRSVVGEVPAMTAAEIAEAYVSARAGYQSWRRANPLDRAAFAQAGQRCTATARLIVEETVAAELTARLTELTRRIVVGSGLDPATTMGPLSYAAHRDGVLEHIERARKEGAEVILGGGFRDSGSAFKEQGAPGLRFYTRIKTAAVRFEW